MLSLDFRAEISLQSHEAKSSEMSKCLSLVHLTRSSIFSQSTRRDAKIQLKGSQDSAIALTGCLHSVGLAPAATGVTAAVGPWPRLPRGHFVQPMASNSDWP